MAQRFWCSALVLLLATGGVLRAEEPKGTVVPAGIEFVPDILYGQAGDEKLVLDLACPKTRSGTLPGLVLIHGGGWAAGSRREYYPVMFGAAQLGYVAITIDYRLAPKYQFPAQLEDAKCAVRWLRANAKKYEVDPDRIGAVGGSAGGHLTALLGATAGDKKWEGKGGNPDQSSTIQAMVCLSGPYDLPLCYANSTKQGATDGAFVRDVLQKFLGGTPKEQEERYRQASPITYVCKDVPPTLLIHGTDDPLVPYEQAELFQKALEKAGAEVELLRLEGGKHDLGKDPAKTVVRLTTYLNKHLKQ